MSLQIHKSFWELVQIRTSRSVHGTGLHDVLLVKIRDEQNQFMEQERSEGVWRPWSMEFLDREITRETSRGLHALCLRLCWSPSTAARGHANGHCSSAPVLYSSLHYSSVHNTESNRSLSFRLVKLWTTNFLNPSSCPVRSLGLSAFLWLLLR